MEVARTFEHEPEWITQVADGQTFYRALAAQIANDWSFRAMRDAVLHFVLRAHAINEHPFHKEYLRLDEAFIHPAAGSLFAALEAPDLAFTQNVVEVVAAALEVQILIYNEWDSFSGRLENLMHHAGDPGLWTCRLVKKAHPSGRGYAFSSVYPNEDGLELLEFLLQQQSTSPTVATSAGSPIKRLTWSWDTNEFLCHNEDLQPSPTPSLTCSSSLNRFDIFVVSVYTPDELRWATDLLLDVLAYAPCQQRNIWASKDRCGRVARPHMAADGEFVKIPRKLINDMSDDQAKDAIWRGQADELLSVLAIAVGRHFTVLVNVVHMLENAAEDTVPALERFFKKTIFNNELIKLWWNPQADYRVIDDTIDYMYQGTPRPVKTRTRDVLLDGVWTSRTNQDPSPFKIQNQFINGNRPNDLRFAVVEDILPEQRRCDLHIFPTSENLQEQACGCHSGNVDIAALLNNFGRQLGLNFGKHEWSYVRRNFNYGKLIKCMLHDDRIFPFLDWAKTRPRADVNGISYFYQQLGQPNMVQNSDAMAYNIGDVVSLNAIFEELTNYYSTDGCSRLGKFFAYQVNQMPSDSSGPEESLPVRKTNQRITQRSVDGIPLFLDYPRARGSGLLQPGHMMDRLEEGLTQLDTENGAGPGPRSRHINVLRTASMGLWEHDSRVAMMRAICGQPGPLPESKRLWESSLDSWKRYNEPVNPAGLQRLLTVLTDPTTLWLPASMSKVAVRSSHRLVVRAGFTLAEDLVRFLSSPDLAHASPPRGFAAEPGSRYGLQGTKRVPGQDLKAGESKLRAYRGPDPRGTGSLRDDKLRGNLTVVPAPADIDRQEIVNEAFGWRWRQFISENEDEKSVDGDEKFAEGEGPWLEEKEEAWLDEDKTWLEEEETPVEDEQTSFNEEEMPLHNGEASLGNEQEPLSEIEEWMNKKKESTKDRTDQFSLLVDDLKEAFIVARRELEINQLLGTPCMNDAADVIDPEGRDYSRRLETSPSWACPHSYNFYHTNSDGSWKSSASLRVEELSALTMRNNMEEIIATVDRALEARHQKAKEDGLNGNSSDGSSW